MRIIKNHKYRYNPVLIDIIHPTYGARTEQLKKGDIVIVVSPPGLIGAKTVNANHCYISKEINGKLEFMGMIHINSLEKI